MATAKKVRKPSRAAKMREYFTANPLATPSEVAKKFKTSYQVAYMCRRGMQPKKLILGRAEIEVANKLGVSTKEYAKQIYELTKGRKRAPRWIPMEITSSNESVKPSITMEEPAEDPVNHPAHYKVGGMETIDFIEAKDLSYHLGNAVKYISRADHKGNRLQDLEKAKWYLERAIAQA
jgi:hypothetical protein